MPMLSGGLLHEIHASMEDWAASIAFAMTSRAAQKRAPLVLIRSPRRAALPLRPYGEGLHALGIDPARLLIVEASDDLALLRAGLEAARCPGISALVLETWGKLSAYDLVASRRLVLAAERSGVAIIMLRLEADPRASAAHTRWQVRSIASPPLATPLTTLLAAKTPGSPTIAVELLRQRGGPAGQQWHLLWDKRHGCFINANPVNAPLPSAVVPMAGQRKGARTGLTA